MADYSELKRLAGEATRGPWVHSGNWVSTERGNSVADCPRGDEAYIAAANPKAVRSLIAENEALRKLAVELRGAAKCWNLHHCKAEQHGISEPCKVLERIDAAIGKEPSHD